MWGEWRLLAYITCAVALGAFLGRQAWLGNEIVVRALQTSEGNVIQAAAELRAAARSVWPLTLAAPVLLIWTLIGYLASIPGRRFTIVIVVLTILTLLFTAAAAVLPLAGLAPYGPPSLGAARIVIGDVSVIVSLVVGSIWMLVVHGRATKLLEAEDLAGRPG